ncbi:MAG: rod shape-determining protein MreD [Acidimicrobiales bacterium]
MVGRLRITLVVFAVVVLQLSLAPQLSPVGVHADLLLLLAVVAGIAWGPERGATLGFVAGLVADLFQQTPFGLSALVFCLVAFSVGSVQAGILRAAWWIPVLTAGAASALGVAAWAIAATVLGQPGLIGPRLAVVAGMVALWNGPLSIPMLRMVGWASRDGVLVRAAA